MLAFAQTWPEAMVIDIGEGLQAAHNAELEALEPIIEQTARPGFKTLVLDIDGHPQRAKATGPTWSDEHRRFFFALFDRWSDRHIIILSNEDRVIRPPHWEVGYRPDVPPRVEDSCDVVLHYAIAFNTNKPAPRMWARCEKHRLLPRFSGVTLPWTAAALLESRIDGG
jgi:hypothetical protein